MFDWAGCLIRGAVFSQQTKHVIVKINVIGGKNSSREYSSAYRELVVIFKDAKKFSAHHIKGVN